MYVSQYTHRKTQYANQLPSFDTSDGSSSSSSILKPSTPYTPNINHSSVNAINKKENVADW